MACDILSDSDKTFLADNLLSSEDFDQIDFDHYDIESSMQSDHDLLSSICETLELPKIEDHNFESFSHENDFGCDLFDSLASVDVDIKTEPLSPPSSLSSNGHDSDSSSCDSCLLQPQTKRQRVDVKQVRVGANPLTGPINPSSILNGPACTAVTIPTIKTGTTTCAVHRLDLQNGQNSANALHTKSVLPIQPKQEISSRVLHKSTEASAITSPGATGNPLVLTPEEFSKLTASGVLTLKPQPVAPSLQTNTQMIAIPVGSVNASLPSTLSIQHQTSVTEGDPNDRVLKRHQRMIKNRESACLSRKKKKDYMSNIEENLKKCKAENAQLRTVNQQLKLSVDSLKTENQILRKAASFTVTKKSATYFLVVVFMFAVNIAPYGSVLFSGKAAERSSPIHHHRGRSLLSLRDDYSVDAEFLDGGLHNVSDLMLLQQHLSDCPMYFNTTDSLRINNELVGWINRIKKHEEEKKSKKTEKKREPSPKKRVLHKSKLFRAMEVKESNRPDVGSVQDRGYQLQLYDTADRDLHNFLSAIRRRNDTFYVVSFTRDHLLLPATAHNKTLRPRMSLVMPSMPLNESLTPPENHIAMMQIDCEVMNTKLIHVRASDVPSGGGNATARDDDAAAPYKEPLRRPFFKP